MKYEMKRVEPVRAANIGALVYGAMMAVFMLIFAPIFLIAVLAGGLRGGLGGGELIVGLGMLVAYPIFGLVFGWLSGFVSACAYNFIVRWTGGMLCELEPADGSPAG